MSGVNWNELDRISLLDQIIQVSEHFDVLIFKHSTICSLSVMVKNRLERDWNDNELVDVKPYFLDLRVFREVSNDVAHRFAVPHQSPQVLIIRNGSCIYDNSHYGISYSDLKSVFSKANMI